MQRIIMAMKKIAQVSFIFSVVFGVYSSSVFASEATAPVDEFTCLNLNIGLLALLQTENTYYQRLKNKPHDPKSAIGQGLVLLRAQGESCPIKQQLYVEAAEYSLHARNLETAAYFLNLAKKHQGMK